MRGFPRPRLPHWATRRLRDVLPVALGQAMYGKPIGGSEQYVRKPFKDFVQL